MPRKVRLINAAKNLNVSHASDLSSSSSVIYRHVSTPIREESLDSGDVNVAEDQHILVAAASLGEFSIQNESVDNLNDSSEISGLATSFSPVPCKPLWSMGGLRCHLDEEDIIIILLAMQSFNRIPDFAMENFCCLLKSVLPPGHNSPSSYRAAIKSALEKFIDFSGNINYLCSGDKCSVRLEKQFSKCTQPSCRFFDCSHQCTAFVTYKIKPQLEMILQRYFPEIRRKIEKAATIPSSSVSDVSSSRSYRPQADFNSPNQELSLHLILSSDGAQPFKCGGSSMWPCVAVVCELPPNVRSRSENCIVLGFWIGNQSKKKPIWTTFLEAAVAELNYLRDGFDIIIAGKLIRVKVEIFCTLFDLPAQASIWSHKQFNGINGCIACFASGKWDKEAKVMLWPNSARNKPKSEHFFTVAWANLAINPAVPYRGVTGISILSKLANPADVNAFDPMHMVYRGNAMLIFSRFFESKPGKWSPLFPPKELCELDKDLSDAQFPIEFNRTVPSLERLATYKASELKNLLVYALIPTTAPFMSDLSDYWHWAAAFVHAVRLLSQNEITEDDVQIAQRLIHIWQELIPDLASYYSQNFNAHGAQHLPAQVLKFGPLWATSAFCFESFNGDFVRLITSAKGPVQQVARRFVLQRYARSQLAELENSKPAVVPLISQILRKWCGQAKEMAVRLEKYVACSDMHVETAIFDYFHNIPDGIHYAAKAVVGSSVYHSLAYLKSNMVRRRSVSVKYICLSEILPKEEYAEPQIFINFDSSLYAVCKKFDVISRSIHNCVPPPVNVSLRLAYEEEIYGSFFCVIRRTDEWVVVPIEDFLCKIVLVPYWDDFIATDVLPYEHD